MEYGYCNICKRKLTGYNDYVIKNNKKICKDCVAKQGKEKTEEEKEKEELYEYLKLLFQKTTIPESWNVFIEKQRKNGKTYSGMQGSLYYFYELKGNAVSYENSAIGIIEYIYDEAKDYFRELNQVNEKNSKFVSQSQTRFYETTMPKDKKIKIDIGGL